MRFKFIIILILFAIIIGGGIFIYFYYDEKVVDVLQVVEFNVAAFDGKKQVITNYTISIGSLKTEYRSGKTLSRGYISQKLPVNKTIYVYNVNIENQSYYTSIMQFDSTDISTRRADIKLIKPSNITFNVNGNISSEELINVTAISDGYYKKPTICLKWSQRFIYVRLQDLKLVDNINGYHKCYESNFDFTPTDNEFNFVIDYKVYGILKDNDYIEVTLLDNDEVQGIGINNQTMKIKN